MIDLSIIIPSHRPSLLAHAISYLKSQSAQGLNFEAIVVQESNVGFDEFTSISYPSYCRILRQSIHGDIGMTAKDVGALNASGAYVAFWDDDNIYYQHAAVSLFLTATKHDIGICRTKHKGSVIPIYDDIKAGEIDTMCLCVRRELAIKTKWADGGGRYSDYRWITKIAETTNSINYSSIVVGEHL